MGLEGVDEVYSNKLAVLKRILLEEIGPEYSKVHFKITKVYDSQDEMSLKIFCKPEIYPSKRFNSYRFTFRVNQKDRQIIPSDYLKISVPA